MEKCAGKIIESFIKNGIAIWSGGRLAIGPNFSNYQELVEDSKIVWVPPPRGRPYIFAIS